MKTNYLHVSYITSKGSGNFMYGDMLINITSNGTIRDLREYILRKIKEDNPNDTDRYQLPTILNITVLKKRMYRQLAGK